MLRPFGVNRPWTRHEGGQSRNEVERLKQNLRRAVAEGMLERVDHPPIAINAQTETYEGERMKCVPVTEPNGPLKVVERETPSPGRGGLGHLGVQYAAKMGFHTVVLSRGADKEPLARELGAHDYIDTTAKDPAEALQAMGGANVIFATAPNAKAISSTIGGLQARGKLFVVGATPDPLEILAFDLLSGRQVAGWPNGRPIDSEATMQFSMLTGVRAQTETYPLEQAGEALQKVLENKVRFRAVLVT